MKTWVVIFVNLLGCAGAVTSPVQYTIEDIEKIVNNTLPCEQDLEFKQDLCRYMTVGFKQKLPSPQSIGQRILVIDQGMRLPAYTRYKSRVLDDIEPSEYGKYFSTIKPIEIRAGELRILSEILDERFPGVSAKSLNHISKKYNQTFRSKKYSPEHGDAIFATLADLNPRADFVIAQLPKPGEQHLCDPNKLADYFRQASNSLIQKIGHYQISFVNMSFGHSFLTLEKDLKRCPAKEPWSRDVEQALKIVKENFYEALFSLENVIFIQAASSFEQHQNSIDCTFFPNRVRAGYIETLETAAPYAGTQGTYKSCTDVIVNTGVLFEGDELIEGPFPYQLTLKGIGSAPVMMPFQSSWAAPIVLSYLNFIMQTGTKKKESVLASLVNSNLMIDPFRHQQFERFR